jgi:hypothetical protein
VISTGHTYGTITDAMDIKTRIKEKHLSKLGKYRNQLK